MLPPTIKRKKDKSFEGLWNFEEEFLCPFLGSVRVRGMRGANVLQRQ